MPSRYRYYEDPVDTPESKLWGGVGRGFQSGIELALQQKIKLADEDRKRKRELEDEGYVERPSFTAGELPGTSKSPDEEYEDTISYKGKEYIKPYSAQKKREHAFEKEERERKRVGWAEEDKPLKEQKEFLEWKAKEDYKETIAGIKDSPVSKALDRIEKRYSDKYTGEILFDQMPKETKQIYDALMDRRFKELDLEVPEEKPTPGDVPENDPAAPGQPKVLTPEIAAEYLQKANGDKNLARQMAAQDGWQF